MTDLPFGRFAFRVTCCHVVTYFVAGTFAMAVLDYHTLFQSAALACYMQPTDAPIVALGPIFQVFRGLIFAAALYAFRGVFLRTPRGWLLLWTLLVGLAILSPVGPAPGSVEGLIYTRIPARQQFLGYAEVLPQTLAFAVLVVAWHRRPSSVWTGIMSGLTIVTFLVSGMGYLAATGRLVAH